MTRDQADSPKAPMLTPVTFVHSYDLNATLQHTLQPYSECSIPRVPKQGCVINQQHIVCEDPCHSPYLDHIDFGLHCNHIRLPRGVSLVSLDGCQPSWAWH